MLLLLLLVPAFASPLTGSCDGLTDGRAVLVDGATLDWGDRSFSCDGDRTCDFSLAGDVADFDATGTVDVAFDCGADELHLSCVGAECTVARFPLPSPEALPVRVGGRLASGA